MFKYRVRLPRTLLAPTQKLMTQCIRSLTGPMLASTEGCEHRSLLPIIDVLDEILLPSPNRVACSPPNLQVSSSLTLDPLFRRKCLLALDKVCVTHRILPARYLSAGNLVVPGESPDYCGGLADVWRGEVDRCPVAVKVTRYYSTAPIFQAQEVTLCLRCSFKIFFLLMFPVSAILPRSSPLGKIISPQHFAFPWS